MRRKLIVSSSSGVVGMGVLTSSQFQLINMNNHCMNIQSRDCQDCESFVSLSTAFHRDEIGNCSFGFFLDKYSFEVVLRGTCPHNQATSDGFQQDLIRCLSYHQPS
ncbi:hypothetical protein J6590_071459 [Homalodisca vitripennis]|nr:hypothetical protein J6590_071459 [Homalodisca vitripennis]